LKAGRECITVDRGHVAAVVHGHLQIVTAVMNVATEIIASMLAILLLLLLLPCIS
jgi:hypothetical protein